MRTEGTLGCAVLERFVLVTGKRKLRLRFEGGKNPFRIVGIALGTGSFVQRILQKYTQNFGAKKLENYHIRMVTTVGRHDSQGRWKVGNRWELCVTESKGWLFMQI